MVLDHSWLALVGGVETGVRKAMVFLAAFPCFLQVAMAFVAFGCLDLLPCNAGWLSVTWGGRIARRKGHVNGVIDPLSGALLFCHWPIPWLKSVGVRQANDACLEKFPRSCLTPHQRLHPARFRVAPFISPCTTRPVKQPPSGGHWLHEPKLDGWRLQAVKHGKDVALYSRHGRPFTQRFRSVAEAIARLPCRSATLDGELVLADSAGVDFYGLRGARRGQDISFWAFDLLELDGKDLRDLPLTARKAHLSKGIEGVVSKSFAISAPIPRKPRLWRRTPSPHLQGGVFIITVHQPRP